MSHGKSKSDWNNVGYGPVDPLPAFAKRPSEIDYSPATQAKYAEWRRAVELNRPKNTIPCIEVKPGKPTLERKVKAPARKCDRS